MVITQNSDVEGVLSFILWLFRLPQLACLHYLPAMLACNAWSIRFRWAAVFLEVTAPVTFIWMVTRSEIVGLHDNNKAKMPRQLISLDHRSKSAQYPPILCELILLLMVS